MIKLSEVHKVLTLPLRIVAGIVNGPKAFPFLIEILVYVKAFIESFIRRIIHRVQTYLLQEANDKVIL